MRKSKFKQGCFPQDELEFLGNGNLEKGIAEINKDGWEIISVIPVPGSEIKYYYVEKQKLDKQGY